MKGYILRIIIIIIIGTSSIKVNGDWLRCFCTESSCVQTNYMCKTFQGSCYSRLTVDPTSNEVISTRYGCDDGGILHYWEKPDMCRSRTQVKSEIESRNLSPHPFQSHISIHDEDDKDESEDWEMSWKFRKRHNNTSMPKSASTLTTQTETRTFSNKIGNTQINNDNNPGHRRLNKERVSVICCDNDMCNYNMDDPSGRTINRDVNSSSNADLQRTNAHKPQYKEHLIASLSPRHANSDLWFKMAVCLVTVVGAAILVVIVISAMRMLRSEKHYLRRQQLYCDCPHNVINAVLVAGDVSSKQQLLFPVADGRYCRCYYKSPLSSPSSVEQKSIV